MIVIAVLAIIVSIIIVLSISITYQFCNLVRKKIVVILA